MFLIIHPIFLQFLLVIRVMNRPAVKKKQAQQGSLSLIFQLPIYLEPGGLVTWYIGNWELGSEYIGNWKIRVYYQPKLHALLFSGNPPLIAIHLLLIWSSPNGSHLMIPGPKPPQHRGHFHWGIPAEYAKTGFLLGAMDSGIRGQISRCMGVNLKIGVENPPKWMVYNETPY